MTARDDLARVIEKHSPASHALALRIADAVIREWLPTVVADQRGHDCDPATCKVRAALRGDA